MHDARIAEFPEGKRHRPRYPTEVWVRVGGAWCAGYVHAWVRTPGGWVMWTQHRVEGVAWPQWEWFVFDPVTVRRWERGAPSPG